jgi:hypothetical protein
MKRIPIKIKKIKFDEANSSNTISGGFAMNKNPTKFLVEIEDKGQEWSKSIICEREVLQKFRDEIDEALKSITTAETLNLNEEAGKLVDQHYESDPICLNCSYRLSFHCKTCLFELQSPLERKLYLELSKARISFRTQYGLDYKGINIQVEGKEYTNPDNNFKNVLTIVDFFIEKRNQRLCIYTDGHTYHERTEDQALRDKNIDRKLQALGYTVLRYTGKEINESMEKTMREIKDWIGYN